MATLHVLFASPDPAEPAAVEDALRAYHRETSRARVDGDRVSWGHHAVTLATVDAPLPATTLEPCLAHCGPALRARALGHAAHMVLAYSGRDADPLEQVVSCAAVAGALAAHGATLVVNVEARASLPAGAIALHEGADTMAMLRAMPLPYLYAGFVRIEGDELAGKVLMRTFGGHTLGLPDLAALTDGHHQGSTTFDLFEDILRYVHTTKTRLSDGHVLHFETCDRRLRSPRADEPWLASGGELYVIEA